MVASADAGAAEVDKKSAAPVKRTWKDFFCATKKRKCVTGWSAVASIIILVLVIVLPLTLIRKNPDSVSMLARGV